ncbi:MAG: hypothetical protein WBD31_08835 [Rubripirellula sp.]
MAIVLPKFPRRRSPAGAACETQPALNVSLCREDGVYQAGGELVAKWRVRRISVDDLQSIEVSVLWHTEGKGDEDLHVHHFYRIVESQIRRMGLSDEQSIRCVLPASPLSYHGHLITVRWCIRMRLFLRDGRKIMAEQPFNLFSPSSIDLGGPLSVVSPHNRDLNSAASGSSGKDSAVMLGS